MLEAKGARDGARLEVLVLEVVGVGSYKCSHCRL